MIYVSDVGCFSKRDWKKKGAVVFFWNAGSSSFKRIQKDEKSGKRERR